MTNSGNRTLLLGLGNPLMRDDGLGLEALDIIKKNFHIPPELDMVDGGTMGLLLLDRVAGCDRLLVADSIAVDHPPGTVVCFSGEEVDAVFSTSLSPHQTGVNDLLAALTLTGERPREVVFIGMVPADLNVGLGLSRPIQANLEKMVSALVLKLCDWGYDVRPKPRRKA